MVLKCWGYTDWDDSATVWWYQPSSEINAAREAAVITCPFIHPDCPNRWAIELVSLWLSEYLFMLVKHFQKDSQYKSTPPNTIAWRLSTLPRESARSQTAGKPELSHWCPSTRDIVFVRGLLLPLLNFLYRIKCVFKKAPIGVSTVLSKNPRSALFMTSAGD